MKTLTYILGFGVFFKVTQTDPCIREGRASQSQLKVKARKKEGGREGGRETTREEIDFVSLKSSMDLAGFLISNHRPNSMSLIISRG